MFDGTRDNGQRLAQRAHRPAGDNSSRNEVGLVDECISNQRAWRTSVCDQSARNAFIGSTEAARRAGKNAAHPDTTAKAAMASTKLPGSNGEIP